MSSNGAATEDDQLASCHSDSDSSSRTGHQSNDTKDDADDDSGRGDIISGANSEVDYGLELAMDDATTKEHRMTPDGYNVDGDGQSFPGPGITDAPITHKPEHCPDRTREEKGGGSDASRKGTSMHLAATKANLTPVATVAQPQQLVSVNQTDFTIEARPTRSGRIRRTCDMVEVTACLCGNPVESESRNNKTAVQCGFRGCETLWVSVFHPLLTNASQYFVSFI